MIWSFARAIVWLKHISVAADRIAIAQEDQARIARLTYSAAHPARRPIKAAEFGVADIEEDWNKHWQAQQESGE